MFTFFRKIRWRLDQDNHPESKAGRFFQYSRYAIGEIVLVVIGILIALQVNNWNENKNIRQIEFRLLRELKKDLAETEVDLLSDMEKAKLELETTDSLYLEISRARMKKEPVPVKISMRYLYQRSALYPKKSAYESLRSYGINLVSNDSLRKNITDFFELHLVRVNDLEKVIKELNEKELGPYLMKASKPITDCGHCESLQDLFASSENMSSNYYWVEAPEDELLHLFKKKYMAYWALTRLYASTQSKMESLKQLIDSEINP